ncbi:hypothetical protein FDG95_gp129 [Pectobacterium phage vB_PcaM_CBB]|uniref:Uncharacterized protein n=1 Tax=Pectobacterium phage vB_PcaM_CBB TaxID=2772511 RepID=A0A1L2CUJ5_9CAUD|nr:hypothetical protein FDG95_gp129 [Pectobacterium phage vB_PcaM_CBB]AMM43694.1 hypothetical protein CBB_129 [Pectobacterium phage vB_PcaM_CBB]
MNSEKLSLARELLLHIEPGEVISTQINHVYNQRTNYDKFPGDVIAWLHNSKLLVLADVISISQNASIEVFKTTTLGEQLAEFANLVDWFNEGVSGEEQFLITGSTIHRVLEQYNDLEVEPLVKLVTAEEQEAYQHYYRIAAMNALKGRVDNKCKEPEDTLNMEDSYVVEVLSSGLDNMFWLSKFLGDKGTDETRTNDYVFKKCMEELGEMALEDQIANGLSYKDAGSDGVAGEAVDLAICAMDMFALQFPGKSDMEIQFMFLEYMNKKLQKWQQTLKQRI